MTLKNRLSMTVRIIGFGIGAIAAVAAVPSAFGQDYMRAKIPFAFQVSGKTLAAGNYEFRIDRQAETVLVTGGQPRNGTEALIITWLAARPRGREESMDQLVFDKSGGVYTLSELWEPGSDGILLNAAKGPHQHHILHSKR